MSHREPKYSSEAVRKALEEADEVHRQIEEATRPQRSSHPFDHPGLASDLHAKLRSLEKRLAMAEKEIKALREVTGIGCIIREHP